MAKKKRLEKRRLQREMQRQEEEFNSGVLSPEELANQKKKWGNGANPNNDYYDYNDDWLNNHYIHK